jgi:hypothetical protein
MSDKSSSGMDSSPSAVEISVSEMEEVGSVVLNRRLNLRRGWNAGLRALSMPPHIMVPNVDHRLFPPTTCCGLEVRAPSELRRRGLDQERTRLAEGSSSAFIGLR